MSRPGTTTEAVRPPPRLFITRARESHTGARLPDTAIIHSVSRANGLPFREMTRPRPTASATVTSPESSGHQWVTRCAPAPVFTPRLTSAVLNSLPRGR